MLTIVAYDVVSRKRRARLARLLEDFGARVQLSVFECDLEAPRFEALRQRIEAIIDADDDSVRLYRICSTCGSRTEKLGVVRGEPEEIPSVYVV